MTAQCTHVYQATILWEMIPFIVRKMDIGHCHQNVTVIKGVKLMQYKSDRVRPAQKCICMPVALQFHNPFLLSSLKALFFFVENAG